MDVSDKVAQARGVHEYLNQQPGYDAVDAGSGAMVELPLPSRLDLSLTDVLTKRRSRYDFTSGDLPVDAVSTVLGAALGLGRTVAVDGVVDHPLWLAPSAGGLASLDVHVAATGLAGLASGVHRYVRDRHALVELPGARGLDGVLHQPEFTDRAAMVIALAARLDVGLRKYPLRHYRTLHVDAGVALQNLYLVSTALGLACCAISGFDDAAADRGFGFGAGSVTVVLFAVGPGGASLPG